MRLMLIAVLATACADEPLASFGLPNLDTSHAILGTAAAGRPLVPNAVRIVDRQRDTAGLGPDFIAGTNIDVVWGGLDAADLPIGITPEDLRFARSAADGTRPLPPLANPHVLRAPSAADDPESLVPIDGDGSPRSVQQERQGRFQTMLSDLEILDPCIPPGSPWQINTPTVSSDAVVRARVMSDGTTALGLSTTSTALIGILSATSLDVQLIGVGLESIPDNTPTAVTALDGSETVHPSGARVPTLVAVTQRSPFNASSSALSWQSGQWRNDTPLLAEALPQSIRGLRTIDIDGVRSVCAFGSSVDTQTAAIWCRPQTTPANSSVWQVQSVFRMRFTITDLFALADGALVAVDVGGTVHRYQDDLWRPVLQPAINVGCAPPCARIDHVLRPPSPALNGFDLWLVGEQLQAVAVNVNAEGVDGTPLDRVSEALFADERIDADRPANFKAGTFSADGALWLATDRRALLRRAPEGHVDRICLPDVFETIDIGVLVAHADGRLLVAGSPVVLAQSTWQRQER